MLTGPLFMLQVYDRVLNSRSEGTLTILFLLVACLFLLMALLDYGRGRVMARVGLNVQESLDMRVFQATLRQTSLGRAATPNALRDLVALQTFYASPAFLALMDTPWTPFFLAAIFIFHPYLGLLAIFGGGMIITLTIVNQLMTSRKVREAQIATEQAPSFAPETRERNDKGTFTDPYSLALYAASGGA